MSILLFKRVNAKRKLLLILSIIIFPVGVFASGDMYQIPNSSPSKSGYVFLGADIGYANNHYGKNWWKENIDDTFGPDKVTDSGIAGRINFGFNFNQYFGLEVGWLLMPEIDFGFNGYWRDFDVTWWQSIVDTSLKVSYPYKQFEFIGKGGLADVLRRNVEIDNRDYGDINDQMTYVLGGGIGYNINQHFMIDASYLHYFRCNDFPGTDFVGVGFAYKF